MRRADRDDDGDVADRELTDPVLRRDADVGGAVLRAHLRQEFTGARMRLVAQRGYRAVVVVIANGPGERDDGTVGGGVDGALAVPRIQGVDAMAGRRLLMAAAGGEVEQVRDQRVEDRYPVADAATGAG